MNTDDQPVPSAAKTIVLLEWLCACEQPRGASDIAKAIGLKKNMVFRLLQTLTNMGWIIRDEQARYQVSLQPFHHASKVVGRLDVHAAALQPMKELWEHCGEFLALVVAEGQQTLLTHVLQPRHGTFRIAVQAGFRGPMHCGAAGKVLLAFNEDLCVRLGSGPYYAATPKTITDQKKLMTHLATVRKNTYATDHEEAMLGMNCIAVPIRNYKGDVIAAINCACIRQVKKISVMKQEILPQLQRCAEQISEALGGVEHNEAEANK